MRLNALLLAASSAFVHLPARADAAPADAAATPAVAVAPAADAGNTAAQNAGSAEAAAAQFDFVPGTTDVDALWKDFLARADFGPVNESYDVILAVQDENGDLVPDACAKQLGAFDRAVKTNPVSLAIWYWASKCAAELGDAEREARALAGFEALAAHAMRAADHDAARLEPPSIDIFSEMDADAFVAATGHEIVYASYDVTSRTELPLNIAVRDPETKRERTFRFQFIDTWMHMARDEPYAAFPVYRALLAQAFLDAQAEVPGSLGYVASLQRSAFAGGDPGAALDALARLADEGHFDAAVAVAAACFGHAPLGCAERAVDIALRYAELEYADAYVLLARAYAEGLGVERDARKARKLLERADERLGRGNGYIHYAALESAGPKDGKRDPAVRKELEKLARDGNARAAALLTVVDVSREFPRLGRKTIVALRRGAEAGTVELQGMYGIHLLLKGDGAGLSWLEKAAERDNAPAQLMLAKMYDRGEGVRRDEALARDWYSRAAHGGSAEAAAALAKYWLEQYRTQAGNGIERRYENGEVTFAVPKGRHEGRTVGDLIAKFGTDPLRAAEGWMHSAVVLGDDAYANELATLWLSGTNGLNGTAEDGARLMGVVIPSLRAAAAAGDADARYDLARILHHGIGIDANPREAIELLQANLEADDTQRSRNDLAWRLCTSPRDDLRDPERGAKVAAPLVRLDNWTAFDTVAACDAATGSWESAVHMAERAVAGATKAGAPADRLSGIRARLESFRARKPYRETDPPKITI